MSLPAQSRPNLKRSAPSGQLDSRNIKREQMSSPQQQQEMTSPFAFGSPFHSAFDDNSNPLSLSLPMNSQQLLAGAQIDMNDPLMAGLMNNPYSNQGQYPYNPNSNMDSFNNQGNFSGLDQTLAPSDLAINKAMNASNSDWDYPDAPQMPPTTAGLSSDKFNTSANGSPGNPGNTAFNDESWSSFIDGGMFGSDEVTTDT